MSDRRIENLDPRLQPLVRELLIRASKEFAPLVPLITDGKRSLEEQKILYGKGRTEKELQAKGYTKTEAMAYAKPNEKQVTWTLESNHLKGKAVDIAFTDSKGQLTYNANYERLAELGESLGLIAGHRWKIKDSPHFELPASFEIEPHWSDKAQDFALSQGWIKERKNPTAPVDFGTLFVILQRLYEDKHQ